MEWTDKIITTEIDRLLEYLIREEEASITEAAEDLGVTEEMVENWVSALVESGLIEKKYTTRKGTVLTPKIDGIQEGTEEIKEKAKEEVSEAGKSLENIPELEEAKKHLRNLEKILKNEEDSIKSVESILKSIKNDESEIKSEYKGMSNEVSDLLDDIENDIGSVEELEDKKEEYRERRERIEAYINSLNKLEKSLLEKKNGNVCEECGKTFETEKGLKIHFTKVHKGEEKGFFSKLKKLFSQD